jgi:hypothetical protein
MASLTSPKAQLIQPDVRLLLTRWASRFSHSPEAQRQLVENIITVAGAERWRFDQHSVEVGLFNIMREIILAKPWYPPACDPM